MVSFDRIRLYRDKSGLAAVSRVEIATWILSVDR